jgi:DNA repair protein RadC
MADRVLHTLERLQQGQAPKAAWGLRQFAAFLRIPMQNLVMGRHKAALSKKRLAVNDEAPQYLDEEAQITALMARLEKLMEKRLDRKALSSPGDVKNLLIARLGNLPNEEMHVIFLDNRHRIIAIDAMFQGSIDSASVYPRVIVQAALKHNAAAVILAHCHPSGVLEPSAADRQLTQQVKSALALIETRLLDHFVVGGVGAVSMAERGWV